MSGVEYVCLDPMYTESRNVYMFIETLNEEDINEMEARD